MSTSSLGKPISLVVVLSAAFAALSCEEPKSSGLVVVLETDLQLPKDIDKVRFEVSQNGAMLRTEEHVLGATGLLLPAEFRLANPGNDVPVSIRVVGLKGPHPRIERGAITPIPSTYVAMLRMPLNFLCAGTARLDGSSNCGDMSTCKQGACASSVIGAAELPAYQPGPWTNAEGGMRDAAANDCFDVVSCFAGSYKAQVDRLTCSFALEQDDPGRISVAIKLPQGSDGICGPGSCWVALDEGPEGWTQNGLMFTLPPALCADRSDGGRFTIFVSNTCAGKKLDTPPCGDWSSATHPAEIDQPTGSTSSPNQGVETPGEPVGTACAGPSLQACGDCGMQRRTCRNGTWGEWGECAGQGVCKPNAAESCGTDGTRACGNTCEWGECTGQTCQGMTVEACGNCGTHRRTCTNGAWSDWGPCLEQGECAPGTTQACGADGLQGCMGNCQWGVCGNQICTGAPSQACGNCGTQTRSCAAATMAWSAWGVCEQEGACEANSTRPCGTRGMQTCGGNCQWDEACTGQVCEGPATQPCGNCGIQARSCDTNTGIWSEWGACTREGACVPGSRQGCGANGSQVCLDSCQWSLECSGQACAGEMTQSCGRCGQQARLCDFNTSQWLPWGVCLSQGACNPGATRRCGAGGTQSCGSDCSWNEECTGQACTGPSSESCGDCGTRTRTCNGSTGQWSAWSSCTGQGPCTPGETEECGANERRTCGNNCRWSTCSCIAGFTACGDDCADLSKDRSHCGFCDTNCGTRECNDGECAPCDNSDRVCDSTCQGCPGGLTCNLNNGACVCNNTDDVCSAACPMCLGGLVCNGSVCVACVNTDVECNATCPVCPGGVSCSVSNQSCACDDDDNACDARCPGCSGGRVCNNGTCQCDTSDLQCDRACPGCPTGLTCNNNGACVCDDEDNVCNASCPVCPGGRVCISGNCQLCNNDDTTCDSLCPGCPADRTCSNGSCVCNGDNDVCSTACSDCPGNQVCNGTTCQAPCDNTDLQCDSACPVCPADRTCSNSGSCVCNGDNNQCSTACSECPGNQVCNGTTCQAPCDNTDLQCDSTCPACPADHNCNNNGSCACDETNNACSASCRGCPDGRVCNGTTCEVPCDNTDLTCDDRCPTCPADRTCNNGSCACVNNNDACSDACPGCSGDLVCLEGKCQTAPCNNTDMQCDDRCPTCPADRTCNASGSCACVNNNDACSDSCPGCSGDLECRDGKCQEAACDNTDLECDTRCPACPGGRECNDNGACVCDSTDDVCSDACSGCPSGRQCIGTRCETVQCDNTDMKCDTNCPVCPDDSDCRGTSCVCDTGDADCNTDCPGCPSGQQCTDGKCATPEPRDSGMGDDNNPF